jgi:predicted metal-binding membrane protein
VAVLTGLGGVSAAAWIYLVVDGRHLMAAMSGRSMSAMAPAMQSMTQLRPWSAAEFGLVLEMWAVMMVAMMVPTAATMTLVYAAVARKAARQASPVAPTYVFAAGYVAMWVLFSLAATASQDGLAHLALLSSAMVSASPMLGGALLIGAGVYQLTPLKNACLTQCRAPANFIAQHWRGGFTGAFRMGIDYGIYCLGCCWILMALLFIGGVMNLVWIAAIAVFILFEKTLPFARFGGRVIGGAMIIAGLMSVTGLATIG